MALFERDTRKHEDSPVNPQHDESATSGSTSDAEDSAAHIAELVRRTTEGHASPPPSSVLQPESMSSPTPVPAPATAPEVPPKVAEHDPSPGRPPRRQPSRQALVAGAVAVMLTVSALALSFVVGSDNRSAATATAAKPNSPAPNGYAVKVTDVVKDCTRHSHGRTKIAFESQNCVKATRSLATGEVSGRPTLFVVSRIQMASVDAAASVKQVLDSTGTGNLNDLLREGRTFPGAPRKMPSSGYASVQTGPVIMVAEAGFLGEGPSSNTIPALRAAAAQVAALGAAAN